MSPIIPHFAAECLNDLQLEIFQNWPKIDKSKLENEEVNIVIQINGKKRNILKTKKDITEEKLINEIKNNEKTKEILKNKTINKYYFVKNRLINFLVN